MISQDKQPHRPKRVDLYNLNRGKDLLRSNLADDPMTRIWANAENRDTGAAAVEAMRARRRTLGRKQ